MKELFENMNTPDFHLKLIDRIEALSEPEQRANLLIRLLVPTATLSPDASSAAALAERIKAVIRALAAQDERDYLLGLLAAEITRIEHHLGHYRGAPALFGKAAAEDILETIQNGDDRQEGYFFLGQSAAAATDRRRALFCAEAIEDLYSFETILRILIISQRQRFPDRPLDTELAEQIESEDGRVRLGGALAELLCRWNRWDAAEIELGKAKAIFDTIEDPPRRQRLISDLFTLKLPVSLLERFIPPLVSIPNRYRILEAHSRAEVNDALRCLELLEQSCDPQTRNRQDADTAVTAAALAYRAKNREAGRSWTRAALEKIAEVENPTARAVLYRTLLGALYEAGENKAAARVGEILADTADWVGPDDFRAFQWRENLTLWSRWGEEGLLAKYIERIPRAERIVVTAIGRVGRTPIPEDRWFDELSSPLWGLDPPENSCAALVKIERLRARTRLEAQGAHSIMDEGAVSLFFEPQLPPFGQRCSGR